MQYIEYWEVSSCYDRDVTHVANFTNKGDADACVGKDMYRSSYRKSITIFDDLQDYEENNRARIRERAIAKLTPEELEALGIRG